MDSLRPWSLNPRFCSSPFVPDLDAYFKRIGYTGDRKPTLKNLRGIQSLQCSVIPFETCDIQLSKSIVIDPIVIENKVVRNKRGGYCFELNTLFFYILYNLGYNIRPLIARTRWLVPKGVPSTPTHLILLVEIGKKEYICDVGFSSGSPTEPVEINPIQQEQPHDFRRIIIEEDGNYLLQVRFPTSIDWLDCYSFKLDEVIPIDIEMGNWWTSAHPNHKFVKNLVVTRVGDNCRYTLFNNTMAIRYIDGSTEKFSFPCEDICKMLRLYFDLDFPEEIKFRCFLQSNDS